MIKNVRYISFVSYFACDRQSVGKKKNDTMYYFTIIIFQINRVSTVLFNNIRTREKKRHKKKVYTTRVGICGYISDALRTSLTCFAFRIEASRCPYDYSLNLSSYKNRHNENYQRKKKEKNLCF
jgi:hypothetical protein